MSVYTHDLLTHMTVGQLADHLFETLSSDPEGEGADARAIRAEVERRRLSDGQLLAAWHDLAAEGQSSD